MARGTFNRRHKGGVLRKRYRRSQVAAKRTRLKRQGVSQGTMKRRIDRTRKRQLGFGSNVAKRRKPSSRTPGRRRRRRMG